MAIYKSNCCKFCYDSTISVIIINKIIFLRQNKSIQCKGFSAPAESSPKSSPEKQYVKYHSPVRNRRMILPLAPRQIFQEILPSPDPFFNDWGFPGENYPPNYTPRRLLDCQNIPRWPEQLSPGHWHRGVSVALNFLLKGNRYFAKN